MKKPVKPHYPKEPEKPSTRREYIHSENIEYIEEKKIFSDAFKEEIAKRIKREGLGFKKHNLVIKFEDATIDLERDLYDYDCVTIRINVPFECDNPYYQQDCNTYNRALKRHEKKLEEYNKRIKKYNTEIEKYNEWKKEDDKKKLKIEKKQLEKRLKQLEKVVD